MITPEISTLMSVIPPVLLLLAGFLLLHANPDQTAGRRLLLYYLVAGMGLALVLLICGNLILQNNYPAAWLANALIPALIGVVTLVLINLRLFKELTRPQKILYIILGAALIGMLVWIAFLPNGIGVLIVPAALILAIFWSIGNKSTGIAFSLSLVALVSLGLINADTVFSVDSPLQPWISRPLAILATLGPVMVVVLAAIFIQGGVKELAGGPDQTPPRSILRGASWLLLAFAILGYLMYTIAWASIWDQTSDGLGAAWFGMEASLAAVGAGMVMAWTSPARLRAAGVVFAVLLPLIVSGVTQQRWLIYHSITDDRAARIQKAVETFHSRSNRYPAALSELTPRDLLWVPNPVIFRGENWCYQGGDDFYRLGAVYREFFSAPISVHVYASQGNAPAAWDCDQRAARLAARYVSVGEPGQPMYPAETPMPASLAPTEAKTASLLYKAGNVFLGGWSPSGNYLLFGIPRGTGNQQEVELNFIDAKTSQVCAAPGQYKVPYEIRGQFVWLPDNRLLILPLDGDAAVIRPCQAEVERLAGLFPEAMTGVINPIQKNSQGLFLLKSAASFWILDGSDLEVRQVKGVAPTPYELHWDQASWSPDGSRLAISRLNGREKKDGSNLFIVSAQRGEVIQTLPMQATSDQSPPRVEWLSDHELLVDVQGDISLADLNTNPWTIKRVMRDIFSLNVSVPDEISTWGSFVEPNGSGYHLGVRVNLPRNQAVYVYHSESGKVEVFRPEGDAILFFPGGDWAQFMKMENPPASRDEFELLWVDAPEKGSQRLEVQGHTPRSYPVLFGNYLPAFQEILFSSSQGISRVSIATGKTLEFWRLAGRANNIQPSLFPSPDGAYLVVDAPGDGLYGMPVER